MTTITIKKTRKGATITMRAGKGVDLRNVVKALAGETVEPKEKP